MELVVTGIKCVSTCRRFLNQPSRVRLRELGPKLNRNLEKKNHNYFVKNYALEGLHRKNNKARLTYLSLCCYLYLNM